MKFAKLCLMNKLCTLALRLAVVGSNSYMCGNLNVACTTFWPSDLFEDASFEGHVELPVFVVPLAILQDLAMLVNL